MTEAAGADKKVDAWMPLWIGSYLADTMTLTTVQHGAYLLLLIAYWRNRGPLDDDDEDLASIVKASPSEWKKLRAKLLRFFTVADGKWTHGRADKELVTAGLRKAAASSKAKAAAEARWKKRHTDAPSDAPSIAGSTAHAFPEDCPTPSPSPGNTTVGVDPPHTAGVRDSSTPTAVGRVCMALKRAGIGDVNPGHPDLQMLVQAGATDDEFTGAAREAVRRGKGFAYMLGIVTQQRQRAAQTAPTLHQGAMPASQPTAAEQRVLQAVPGLAAPHLRAVPAAVTIEAEVTDVTPRVLG